jgi:hypothetical protein
MGMRRVTIMARAGMITPMGTDVTAPPAARSRLHRVGLIVATLLLAVVLPAVIAGVLAGSAAVTATLLGTGGALGGAARSGWSRALRVVPLVMVATAIASWSGIGWTWVAVLGVMGAIAGAGYAAGYLPAVLYGALAPEVVPQAGSLRDAILVALFAGAGGAIGVLLGRRLGAPPATPAPRVPRRPDVHVVAGASSAIGLGGAAALAVATGIPHGYWIPLTVSVVAPGLALGDTRHGRQRLVGNIGGLALTIPLSLVPMPSWGFYAASFALFTAAFSVMSRNYGWYALLESAAVVFMVSGGQQVAEVGEVRAGATVIGFVLVAITAGGAAWLLRRMPRVTSPAVSAGS